MPGGCDAANIPSDIVEVYDPQRDKWQTGAPLPHALCHYALGVMEGKLYMFGGWNGQQAVADVLMFDPSRDEWSEGLRYRARAPMQRLRSSTTASIWQAGETGIRCSANCLSLILCKGRTGRVGLKPRHWRTRAPG